MKDGQLWIIDKWIAKDYTYHFQLLKIISVEKEKYQTITNEEVDKDTYNIFEKGELWLTE